MKKTASRVRISDVASACGLSSACVSFILNDDTRYSFKDETVKMVKETARRLKYRANPAAVSLRTQKSNIIIGVMGHASRYSDLELAVCFKQELYKRGFYLVIQFMTDMNDRDKVDFFSRICQWGAGIAVWSFGMQEDSREYEALKKVLNTAPPTLCFSYPIAGTKADYIEVAFRRNFDRVGKFFHENGCRRIIYCRGNENVLSTNAFLEQNRKFGMDISCLSALSGKPDVGLNYHAMGRFLAQHILMDTEALPDGIYCFSDEIALEIREAFLKRFGRFPLIVGGGDSEYARKLEPPMPVFVHDVVKQAEMGAEDLVRRIHAGEISSGTGRSIGVVEQNIVVPEPHRMDEYAGFKIQKRILEKI